MILVSIVIKGRGGIGWEYSLLELAIKGEYVELTHNLLKNGANINIKLDWENKVVFDPHCSKKVMMPQNVEMVKLLVAYNIPIQESTSEASFQLNQTFMKSKMIKEILLSKSIAPNISELHYKIIKESIDKVEIIDDLLTKASLNILDEAITQQLALYIRENPYEKIIIPQEYEEKITKNVIPSLQKNDVPNELATGSSKEISQTYPAMESAVQECVTQAGQADNGIEVPLGP